MIFSFNFFYMPTTILPPTLPPLLLITHLTSPKPIPHPFLSNGKGSNKVNNAWPNKLREDQAPPTHIKIELHTHHRKYPPTS